MYSFLEKDACYKQTFPCVVDDSQPPTARV